MTGPGRRGAAAFGALALLALPAGSPAAQERPRPEEAGGGPAFALPLRCVPGETCWAVNHLDRDPGPGRRDHACGAMTYDAHDGTDLAIRDLAAMRAGVEVLAAAPGTVAGVRDGMADAARDGPDAPPIAGRECGNGVRVEHGGGWESQACHLRRGSVRVRDGERVAAGDVLGLVGLSGDTVFPHLHFEVRRDGASLDPFLPDPAAACDPGAPPGDDLWAPEAARALAYRGGEVYLAGVASGDFDDAEAMRDGLPSLAAVAADAPAVTVFMDAFGLEAGDSLRVTMADPDGAELFDRTVAIERTQIRRPFFARKSRPEGGWAPGEHRVRIEYARGRGGPPRVRELAFTVG